MVTSRSRQTYRDLAAAFCANARSFYEMARRQRNRHTGTSAYYLAIAIELGLKAYLLHRGITDRWNRVHLRHDLSKALRCVRRAGLKDIPDGISELADLVGPLYASGALSRGMPTPVMPMPPPVADLAVGELLTMVEAIIADGKRGDG